MVGVRDVPAQEFINKYAEYLQLQGRLNLPGYVEVVKTGIANELPPQESQAWFYKRTAAVARHVYLNKTVGVGTLKRIHGGSKNRGVRPSHHKDGSGSINRKVLQALEEIGVVEQAERGGRRITATGQRDLDRIAASTLEELEDEEE